MKKLLGFAVLVSASVFAGDKYQQDQGQQQQQEQNQNQNQEQDQNQDQNQGQHQDQNQGQQDQSQGHQDQNQGQDQGQNQGGVVQQAVCPNGTQLSVTCVNKDKSLTVLFCPAVQGWEDNYMVVNGICMKAKPWGNYAAYVSYRSNYQGMVYDLGLTSKHEGGYASGFFAQTAENHPVLLTKSEDVFCQLPF